MNALSRSAPSTQTMPTGPRATACISCQKQKVRCRMDNGKPPCQRCLRRHATCTLRKYNLTREEKENLGSSLVHDLKVIHDALNDMRRVEGKVPLPPLQSTFPTTSPSNDVGISDSPGRSEEDMEEDLLVDHDSQSSTVEVDINPTPIRSLYQITRLKSLRSGQISSPSTQSSNTEPLPRDIISTGLLGQSDASRLVHSYLSRSDHYLYEVAGKYKDLESIRLASPLLLVAICTVAALQDSSTDRLYRTCHGELRRLILGFIFKPSMNLEDLRGLVIASFWLSDISWAVSGLAIRRALEVDLQNTFTIVAALARPDTGSSLSITPTQDLEGAVERMKLWYLLYICDQHLSVLYARSPMLGNQESIRNFETYLNSMPDSVCNQRLMSQVSLLYILRNAAELFGVDSHERIPAVFKPQLDNFNNQVDAWAGKWLSCYPHHPVVGNYPSKAVSLHYHFAKLVICSYVFRGLADDTSGDLIPTEFRDTAQVAIQCALSIVNLTIADTDLAAALTGLPHYFHSMIAYACAFLLKTVKMYRSHIDIDVDSTRDIISKVIQLCNSRECGQQHLVRWIGRGLQTMLMNCFEPNLHDMPFPGSRETQAADNNEPVFNGEAIPQYPCPGDHMDALNDPDLIQDGVHQTTYTVTSERSEELGGGTHHDIFSAPIHQYNPISYPTGAADDGFFLSSGSQAHMEHFGLGLELLK